LIGTWFLAAFLAIGIRSNALEDAPVDEAQIERLLEALPYSEQLRDSDAAPDPEELARLQALNPGRHETVRQLLETQRRCEVTIQLASTRAAFQEVGRRLGRTKVDRLIQFYSGPDFHTLTAIDERSDRGEGRTEPDLATIARIMRDYPLMEMAELIQSPEVVAAGGPNMFERFEGCLLERNAAFDQTGLRQTPDERN
jgi:hypothetical protein